MDPNTGNVYSPEEIPMLPTDVQERLVPVDGDSFLVQKEAQELGEILDEFAKIKEMPAAPPEQYYPINRAARRDADKRNRAVRKRDPRG